MKSLSLVKRIISSNEDLDLVRNVDFDDKANTSLHLAAFLGLPEIAEYLLDHGHEDHGISRNTDGTTPLMAAMSGGEERDVESAIGKDKVARLLIERFPNSTGIVDSKGMNAFSHGSRNGVDSILSLLLSLPPPPDLLPIVADDDDEEAILPPSEHPFLRVQDEDGNTPLHHASAAGQLKTLRLLMMAGADDLAKNKARWTPVDYSATVAAEVYFRNLAKEREHTKEIEQGIASGAVNITRLRGPSDVTRGAVRLVPREDIPSSESGSDSIDRDSATSSPAE